jgi:hypothetical protein
VNLGLRFSTTVPCLPTKEIVILSRAFCGEGPQPPRLGNAFLPGALGSPFEPGSWVFYSQFIHKKAVILSAAKDLFDPRVLLRFSAPASCPPLLIFSLAFPVVNLAFIFLDINSRRAAQPEIPRAICLSGQRLSQPYG